MPDGPDLRLPPDATADEAAAIVAAVEQWLAEEAGAAGSGSASEPWRDRRFALAARLEKEASAPGRIPRGVPSNPWSAAARIERL